MNGRGVTFIVVFALLTFASRLNAGPLEDFSAARAALLRNDYATALQLLRSLSTQEFAGAKYLLGMMYSNGLGVTRDYSTAFRLQREGAEQGHALSQYELGAMYDGGFGVSKNQTKAFQWFRRSAEQGYGRAQVNLGAMYATGEGAPQDYIEAYKWFSIAAKGGGYLDNDAVRTDAAKRVTATGYRMSSARVTEAKERARQWHPRPEPLVPH